MSLIKEIEMIDFIDGQHIWTIYFFYKNLFSGLSLKDFLKKLSLREVNESNQLLTFEKTYKKRLDKSYLI